MTGSRLEAKRNKLLHRNNAQGILQALKELEERRAEFTTRWVWELIQNARDFPAPARPMTIRITVTPRRITFAHNGRDFSGDEILSLIYHGSTKQSDAESLGEFGAGFLSTHLLSRKVRVKGTLHKEDGQRRGFEFELDRSGTDADQVGDAMDKSYRALTLDDNTPGEWTEYDYDVKNFDTSDLEESISFAALPYILVFDNKISEIELSLLDGGATYLRGSSKIFGSGLRLVTIVSDPSPIRFATWAQDGVEAAVPLIERADGIYDIASPGEVPRLFKYLPLVNTVTIGLPVVLHSGAFLPTASRDGLEFVASGDQEQGQAGGRTPLGGVGRTSTVSCLARITGRPRRRSRNYRWILTSPGWPTSMGKKRVPQACAAA